MVASIRAAIIPVYNTNDAFAGSLRQAIQDAPPNSSIVFQIPTTDPGYNVSTGGYVINLTRTSPTSDSLIINKSLIIDAGTQKITIQRSLASGTPNFQIFKIFSGTVTLANLAITGGNANGTLESGGSAIYTNASLTLKNCAIYSNSGGGLGAVENVNGSLVISHCTFSNNSAIQVGAIDNDGALAIDNSTFTGNKSSNASTGGIYNSNSTPAQIRNTIVVGNTGGNTGTVPSDVTGAFASGGYNLIGSTSGSTGFPATGDQVGVTPAAAKLGLLQDNGGPTFTIRPQAGSVAIDQGKRGVDVNGQPITTDQRGYPGTVDLATPNAFGGDGSDIGAVELGAFQAGPTFVVTNTADHFQPDEGCTTDDCTLLEAITAANANADANTITFASGIGPQITLPFVSGYPISAPVNIVGPGARQLTISGELATRIFNISAQNVTISGLTLTNARASNTDGGAIYNTGSFTLTNCTVRNNSATNNGSGGGNGGGLFNVAGATAVLSGCTFSGNQANFFGGGAVCNVGQLTATNCTFSGNSAPGGGGILAISNNATSLTTLRNCTITNNTATEASASTSGGGGYYAEGGVGNTLHHFSNTIIAGNFNARNPDLRGYATSEGNNIIGNLGQNGSGFSNGVNGDKVGVSAGLNSLGNNGGPTDTCSLLGTSVAINMGNDALAPSVDQRGYLRSGVSDIGAYEFNGTVPVLKITSITHLANGHILLQGLGIANTTHTIQAASDPSPGSFTFLGSATSNAMGAVQYDDPGAVGLTKRFYRLAFP